MRTSKRYTNTTFTRRVDHLAGSHRGPVAAKGIQVCTTCGCVYRHRRWVGPDTPRARGARALAPTIPTVCPACLMAEAGQFAGEVRLSGAFLAAHRPDVEQLLKNEAGRAAEDNPLARILSWRRRGADRLTVRTTTEHLAKRLGQALYKAFRGTVHYEFSHENKFAHVTWSRER